jgi:hypothetical protein
VVKSKLTQRPEISHTSGLHEGCCLGDGGVHDSFSVYITEVFDIWLFYWRRTVHVAEKLADNPSKFRRTRN